MTPRPRREIVLPVGRGRLAPEQAAEAAGDRLDRRERVVQLVAEHADQPLPRLALLLAQRLLRSVSTSSWCGSPRWRNVLRRTSQRPAPPGKRQRADARRLGCEPVAESELVGAATEQPLGRRAEQAFAGAVHEPQPLALVEGEDRDVDLRHDRAQQRRRFERAEPLPAQRLGERVDLELTSPSGSSRRAARADREVAFAQRREQVRERLQRAHDALAQRRAGSRARQPTMTTVSVHCTLGV